MAMPLPLPSSSSSFRSQASSSFPAASPPSSCHVTNRDSKTELHHRTVPRKQQREALQALLLEVLQKLEEKEGKELIIERFKSLRSFPQGMGHRDEGSCTADMSLTSLRRLKVLDVHEYVHSSLQQSYLRSLLQNRKMNEC